MGNSPSSPSPLTSLPTPRATTSSSTTMASSTAAPPANPPPDLPPPYSSVVQTQEQQDPPPIPPRARRHSRHTHEQQDSPPPVPPRSRQHSRHSNSSGSSVLSSRPHRRAASHATRPSVNTPTPSTATADANAPGDGVGGFLTPQQLSAGSHFTRANTTAGRSQEVSRSIPTEESHSRRHSSRSRHAHPDGEQPHPRTPVPPKPSRRNSKEIPSMPTEESHSRRRHSSRSGHAHTDSEQPQPRTAVPPRPSRRNSKENPLDFLKKFDTIIIVDDSSSMEGALWIETRDALAGIADAAARYGATGIDLYFLNDRRVGSKLKSAAEVKHCFDNVTPNGITPTGEKLEELLLDYLLRLESPDTNKPKPVNIVILTDGAPTDDPESVIVAAAKRLDNIHAPISQVGIQFVQIGSDPEATEALQELDDELGNRHGIRDMVDTTLYTGKQLTTSLLGKILLGGINRRVDKKGFQAE